VRSVSSSDSSTLGYGAALYSAGYAELAGVLERLQLPPTAVTVMHDCAVGQGNFAVVYKAVLGNKVCAAKVSVCVCMHACIHCVFTLCTLVCTRVLYTASST
jgi:hypothetical protein